MSRRSIDRLRRWSHTNLTALHSTPIQLASALGKQQEEHG